MLQYLVNADRLKLDCTPVPVYSRRVIQWHDSFYYLTADGRIRGRGDQVHPLLLARSDAIELINTSHEILILTMEGGLYASSNGLLLCNNVSRVISNIRKGNVLIVLRDGKMLIRTGGRIPVNYSYRYIGLVWGMGFGSMGCTGIVDEGGKGTVSNTAKTVSELPAPNNYFRCTADSKINFYRPDGSVIVFDPATKSMSTIQLCSPIIDLHHHLGNYLAVLADGRVYDSRTDSERKWLNGRVISLGIALDGTQYTVLLDNDEIRQIRL